VATHDRNLLNRRTMLRGAGAIAAAPLAAALLGRPAHAAAPLLGATKPTFARYRLGDFELTMLADSDVFIDGPYPLIGANAGREDVEQLMRDNLLPASRYQPGFTPMLLNTGKELLIFDTGNGSNGFVPRPEGGWLAAQLAAAGTEPEAIDVVVLSHGHSDHVGGIIEAGQPLFPNARYVIAATEYDFWSGKNKLSDELEKYAGPFRTNLVPLAGKVSFLKPGEDVVTGVRSLAAPGHTPGHLAFIIESGGRSLLFWGDCAHHQVASLARPDWDCVFDVDKRQAAETRKQIYDLAASERLPVAGYHMPFPSLGYVERLPASGYRWLPHSYQLGL
jgi:glyoxylase-like metal-dependent hydrolase (beta-lactamase superfamily II)